MSFPGRRGCRRSGCEPRVVRWHTRLTPAAGDPLTPALATLTMNGRASTHHRGILL